MIRRYAAYALIAVGVAVGLYFSHRMAYQTGARAVGQAVLPPLIHEDEDADCVHLHYGVLGLRVYVQYPETPPAVAQEGLRAQTKMWALGVETRVIPRLRNEGRTEEVVRLTDLVREARVLLDASAPSSARSVPGKKGDQP